MIRRHLAIGAALALLTAAPPAAAWTAINRLDVFALGTPGTFEVIESRGAGPRGIWCAAADFARAQLGLPTDRRIYILAGRGDSRTRPGRIAVAFTVTPDPAMVDGPRPGRDGRYFVSTRTPGFSLAYAHARSFCDDVFEDNTILPRKH